jgi:hypothetical protein
MFVLQLLHTLHTLLSPNLYVEILIPREMAFGGEAFRR